MSATKQAMKYFGGLLGGAFEGARLGMVNTLDSSGDDSTKRLLTTLLLKAAESTKLSPDRQKRLIGLLRDAADELHKKL
jgi:hypothetical protein